LQPPVSTSAAERWNEKPLQCERLFAHAWEAVKGAASAAWPLAGAMSLRHPDDLRGRISVLGALRSQDQKIEIGTNVTNPHSRVAPVTANNFAT
jgi:hypothetical protein